MSNTSPTQQMSRPLDDRTAAIAQRMKTIKSLAERSREQLAQALPKHLTVDRMLKVFYSALSRPDAKGETPLLECSPLSLLMSLMRAAELGLEPNTGLGLSYLVPYRNARTRQRECQLIPGYRGLVQLARQSGAVRSVEARVVREKDAFKLAYGLDQVLEHAPFLDGDPGRLRLVYAVAHLVEGDPVVEVMSRAEIDAIRARSKMPDGAWASDYEEMARKTVIRRITKFLPASTDPQHERARAALEAAVEIDNLAAEGRRTTAIVTGADTLALIAEAGEIPGVVVDDEDRPAAEPSPAAANDSGPPNVPAERPPVAGEASLPPANETAPAPTVTAATKPARKTIAEQREEDRQQAAEIEGQVRAFEDIGELESWSNAWKESPRRKKLAPGLVQGIERAITERAQQLQEAERAAREPGSDG